ncbi:DUF349 domain-containing protein [Arsenicibacter rosenii]|uniref:DUF349 domain-containing protein n=1 Tax=Arsenicibacter rosenii TaxID=1750698 RepID=A0A1S2VQ49_9BACT|nr:DUF349 domain-containing protein [Arsenicibacter rosenii]OIN60903.1 hypothetical protein BLX24_02100 [Arsenicibacter rosenii]
MANEEKEIKDQEDLTSKSAGMLELDVTEDAAARSADQDVTEDAAAQFNQTETAESAEPTVSEPTASAVAEETPEESVTAEVSNEAPVEEAAPAAEPTAAVTETAPEASVPDELVAQYADIPDLGDDAQAAAVADYSQFSKQDFVDLLDKQLTTLKAETVSPGDFKRADDVLKEVKPLFDQIKQGERSAALQKYVQENESEEGFTFKSDATVTQFDDLYKQIKNLKNTFFQNLDKAKDANFASKTELLRQLRELVENDENNAGDPKTSWNEFKRIQDEWKAAGNINSPHNATLWATYHALVDRYYSNRNIYFELKELDRKRNSSLKIEVIEKVEALAKDASEKSVTRQVIDEANSLFEEYKHIGPAPKAEQELLWQRMKAALDALYEKRREQTEEQRKEAAHLYEAKSTIYETLIPFTSFSSSSINEWNDKTKEVMAIQEQWNAIKGSMPREEGKELSKKFWSSLKTFFHNKGEFFKELESKREQNLKLKTSLCEQVEGILESGDDSPEATQTVIDLQRQWKSIGQVPEKHKNTIFDRFKQACDSFFNRKRNKNLEVEREFEENLAKKIALIERIEATAKEGGDLSQLNAFKKEWSGIGFVPKKDMQSTQKRYINAINSLVGATGKLSSKEKERVMQENEAEFSRDRGDRDGGSRGGNFNRGEGDIRRRISTLENDIATYRNNIEFFARSKNADKLKADIEKKIASAQAQLNDLRQQLKAAQG